VSACSIHVALAQRLDEVVVTATRSDQALERTLADVVVIDSQRIRDSAGSSLAELLRSSAGVEISQNGGAGAITGLFVRGTKTAQTVVLVDGVRIEDPVSGLAPIEFLPISAIERIEVVRGPAAALYGSGAIGGVIQIFTRESQGMIRPEASVVGGSRGTGQVQARISGGTNESRYMLAAMRDTTRGFDATREGSGNRQVDEDGHRQTSFTGLLSHRLSRDLQLGAQLLSSSGRSRYDSAFGAPTETFVDFRTQVASLFARARVGSAWDTEFRVGNSAYHYSYGEYSFAPRTDADSIGWQNTYVVRDTVKLLLGSDHRRQRIDGMGIVSGGEPFTQTRRTHQSAYGGFEVERDIHQFRVVTRNDRVTGFDGETTALAAWGIRPTPGWLVRASAGSAFRVPNFQDMFSPLSWNPNPNLRPERSVGQELAIERNAADRYARAIMFRNRIRDAIELDADYKPQNLAKATVMGVTAEAGIRLGDWRLRSSLTRQQPVGEKLEGGVLVEGPLARRAKAFGTAGAEWKSGPWRSGVDVIAQGSRFDTTGQGLGGYALVDLWGSRQLTREVAFTWRLANLTDRHYETAWGFRSPPRTALLGLRYMPAQ
jgi:vitamin B12 transporter